MGKAKRIRQLERTVEMLAAEIDEAHDELHRSGKEQAATNATIVDGLARLEARVAKKRTPDAVPSDTRRPRPPSPFHTCNQCSIEVAPESEYILLCPACDEGPYAGCPCCPGVEHVGGQTFEVALTNMRRVRAVSWAHEGGSCHMGDNGKLYHPNGRRWYASSQAIESIQWRKAEP